MAGKYDNERYFKKGPTGIAALRRAERNAYLAAKFGLSTAKVSALRAPCSVGPTGVRRKKALTVVACRVFGCKLAAPGTRVPKTWGNPLKQSQQARRKEADDRAKEALARIACSADSRA